MIEPEQLEQLLELVAGPLETLILQRLSDGHYRLFGRPPAWVSSLVEGKLEDPVTAFPFLENFLAEAESIWRERENGSRRSGFWAQPSAGATPLHLTARAIRVGELELLAIASSEDSYRDHQLLAQRGRESALALERLNVEIQKKEILVHSIVHDLAVPINAVSGALGLLDESSARLPQDLVKLVEAASRASRRQAALVREILDAFLAEQQELASVERTWARAPDARAAVRAAVEWLGPQARSQAIELDLEVDEEAEHRVVGEASHLERVFTNLMENAVRVSPKGGRVAVRLTREAKEVRATVDDQGPGVPESLRSRLFEKFAQGKGLSGRAGLGLYFCAMMVGRWGGDITVLRSPSGGARFELRFLRPSDVGRGESLVDAHQ
jgi:signal transduction histidine kinase